MKTFMKILRHPDPIDNGGEIIPEPTTPPATPPETPPVTPPIQEQIPKNKEEWDNLAKENPQRWINLTQSRMDQVVRQGREAQEKLAQEQAKSQNLSAELEKYKVPPTDIPKNFDGTKPFSRENMPQTKDQWDQLWIEEPNLAADLRHFKNQRDLDIQQRQTAAQTEFAKARKESAKIIWDRHPDMYVQDIDESGNIKVDGNGKPILKLDPNTGAPMLNLESEKGKLFVQVYTEDPQGYDGAKYGPRLAMAEMERRLQDQGKQQIQAAVPGGQPPGGQPPAPDQHGVMPGGVTPPVTGKVSFSSDEEKGHATRAVERGVYKSLEEYCQLRDGKNTGIVEENSTPIFSKK